MTLSATLTPSFRGQSRSRGLQYFRYGQVRIRRGSDTSVEAVVEGSQEYLVNIDFKAQTLFVVCDCPHFDREGACKHIWATILAAEPKGYLEKVTSAQSFCFDDSGHDLSEDQPAAAMPPRQGQRPAPKPPEPEIPAWRKQLADLSGNGSVSRSGFAAWPSQRQIVYLVDGPGSATQGDLILILQSRDRRADGTWKSLKNLSLQRGQVASLPLSEDREILAILKGGNQYFGWSYGAFEEMVPTSFQVKHPLAATLMPLLARTGRCFLRVSNTPETVLQTPLFWDESGAWQLHLEMRRNGKGWRVSGSFYRHQEQMELSAPILVTQGGLVFTAERVAPVAEETPFQWISRLRQQEPIEAPEKDRDDLIATLLCTPGLPPLEVPEDLRYEKIKLTPTSCLQVRSPQRASDGSDRLRASLSFDYEGRTVAQEEPGQGWYEADHRRFLSRDSAAETAAAGLLAELGAKFQTPTYSEPRPAWEIAQRKLPGLLRAAVEAGWRVEAEGKLLRRPNSFHVQVSSGVDWFDLHGEVKYGESTAQLPELIQALRRGENMVRLGDGTFGMLPEEWLRRYGHLAALGTEVDGHLRFRPSQAGLLDILLAAQPEASCDETFARVRQELGQFQGVAPAQQPAGFVGDLRRYQREGLGWMQFLQRFTFGGCLADDMGVGKTAQVLALLETRREKTKGDVALPSLAVVPKSLVFNWKLEAERFTPQLRVLDYTGLSRNGGSFTGYDLVLTTYGTLRRDASRLKDQEFDYIVLDEAQAIKNAATESAKAVRLLHGRHRLALSGTPVENHLGELWSIFEFLNPGMLGTSNAFALAGGATRNPNHETRKLLAGALRPFILRRTKEQVAKELPPKSEQTIYCVMDRPQRKLYDELLQHYRKSLLRRIETDGLAKSKIQVLEALLRLRQAACHPGLLDSKRSDEPSAKLDVLIDKLREILDEGHKALVFSQFTSLLKIVRNRLDAMAMTYEYLDGSTSNRQEKIERFQNSSDCKLFLISLKAGGLGLNLTAAGYVFLLDPWWNPAVEAQAVDRTHRIGQTQQVFAYRLIARDTVEEKVLELQRNKRDLAADIIGADNSLIRNLQREDLELLLS